MWLVVVAAAGASWFLSESRKAPIRVPLKDGVGAAEFDCRNVRMRFFLSFDDRPAGPEGPRHVALPASAWARGGLVHSSRLIAGPLYDWRPCLASGRWDLLNFLWHVHGPMNESPESGYEPFVAASSRAYLGERRFLDGRNFVRFSMPTAPLPEGMPTQSPTSLWLVPDRPDRLMEDLWKLFLAAVVGGSGLLLLLAGWGMRAARARPRSQAIMTRGDPDSFELDRFYLSSTEDVRFGSGPPFVCSPVARLRLGDNDQILVIRISPPLQTGYSRPSCATIETLAITPHVEGDTLFPVSKWPLSVHVYADLPPLKRGRTFSLKRGTMLAWCDIYRDLPSAEARSV
jgi:hypothetical protein